MASGLFTRENRATTLITHIGIFMLGLIFLYYGAEGLVKGSSRLATSLGIKPIIVGLTVVAFGTSAPEFVVCLMATLIKSQDIATGNIIGSNIANIALVLGLAAVISPLRVELNILRREVPVTIFASAVLFLMAVDSIINFIDGAILFTGIVLFTLYLAIVSLRDLKADQKKAEKLHSRSENRGSMAWNGLLTILGLVGLVLGARLVVQAAVAIAIEIGIDELTVGLTVVALGTSLPELATCIVAAYRKEADIIIGNVLGSNLFNVLFVVGLLSMISPLGVEKGTLTFEFPIMLFFSIVLLPLMRTGLIISRREGALLVIGYAIFIALLFNRHGGGP